MKSKLIALYLTLVALALTSAENWNISTGVGPALVPEDLLQILLAIPNSPPPVASDVQKPSSVWSRMISPVSRMVSYFRQFVCSTPSVSPPSPAPSGCSCGIKGSGRIVGGQAAGQQEWPWQAYLLIDSKYGCGGSLINENWVVTASHCTYGKSQVKVFLGRYNLSMASDAEHVSDGTIKMHPNYNPTTIDNDIALVRMNTPVTFSTSIRPICLPYKYATMDFANQNAVVTGWGATTEGGSSSKILLEVSMPVLNRAQCTTSPYLFSSSRITDNMFCMYKGQGYDSCQGDSGGPVNWQGPSNTYLIGVVSFGVGCGRLNYPGVYAKVTNYLNWIDSTTGQLMCNP